MLCLVAGYALFAYHQVGAWAVLVGGELLATVDSRYEFERHLEATIQQLQQELGRPVRLGQITFRRVGPGAETVPAADLVAEMRQQLPLLTTGTHIVVDGQPVVATSDEAAARQAVALVLERHQAQLTKRSGVQILSLGFQETVTYQDGEVPVAMLRTPAEAATVLERGTDRVVEHRVQRGESLWTIARKAALSVTELRRANPQVRGDLVRAGDRLNLVVPDPFLTVASREQHVYRQAIPFATQVRTDAERWPWERVVLEAGRSGQKELTVEISRVDGQEVSRRLLSEVLLSEPVTRIVVQGTRMVPDRGSGTLVWPVASGNITSPFGRRGRGMHTGIDIAGPIGTHVFAADSGTVTVSQSGLGGFGQVIFIDHGGGAKVTVYAHLSRRLVSVGDVVEKGQLIGHVGNTGRSTGPHLHFEVRIDGRPVNPLQFYPRS